MQPTNISYTELSNQELIQLSTQTLNTYNTICEQNLDDVYGNRVEYNKTIKKLFTENIKRCKKKRTDILELSQLTLNLQMLVYGKSLSIVDENQSYKCNEMVYSLLSIYFQHADGADNVLTTASGSNYKLQHNMLKMIIEQLSMYEDYDEVESSYKQYCDDILSTWSSTMIADGKWDGIVEEEASSRREVIDLYRRRFLGWGVR